MIRKLDRVTAWYLAAVALAGIVYVCFCWTPSSYGEALDSLGAIGAGPDIGESRPIRSDEWAVSTPYFQAAVRNQFRRINETSFYREDMRNFYALPLADWSLIFKPQLWAFFVAPPAAAFSIYFAILMCGFLAGYQLLFRELGTAPWLAAAVALLLYFSGFTQFWWTTYGPLLATLPWVLLVVLHPMAWWKKLLLSSWIFPICVLSHVYPTLLITFIWGSLFVILAMRPAVLRSPGNLAVIGAGSLVTIAVVLTYYADVIPVMRNTVFPGHRVAASGGPWLLAVVSQIFPFLTFRFSDYQCFSGPSICEIGAVGSFFPIATLCLTRYRKLRDDLSVRRPLWVLLAALLAISLWETLHLPNWIGNALSGIPAGLSAGYSFPAFC